MKYAALLLVTLGACKPGAAPQQVTRDSPVQTPKPDAACRDAACWQAQADAAQQLGLGDVASAYRGRAFEIDRSPARLTAWIDGMISDGEHRHARDAFTLAMTGARAQNDRALLAIDAHRFNFVDTPAAPTLAMAPADARLREAYQAAADGRITDATQLFHAALGPDAGPARIADATAAISPHAHDDPALQDWTRRRWARARVLFREQGASLRMTPVERWMLDDATWLSGQLVVSRNIEVLDVPGARLGSLERRPLGADAAHHTRFYPDFADAITLSSDGTTLLRAGSDGSLWHELLLTGDARRLGPPGPRLGRLASVGAGDGLRILVADEKGATLRDATGAALAEYRLGGTTPTIVRRYTGEGTHHDNILGNSPSWPVALAMTSDARLLALGASDSQIYLFDRTRGKQQVLTFQWDYEERRHQGGNPDLNLPLALRFDASGHTLLAVYAHGDLIRWDTRSGKSIAHLRGTCSASELEAVTNRFVGAGEPRQTPTDDDRRRCGRATTAAISDDGRMLATGGINAIRVRDTGSGEGLALLTDSSLPGEHLRFAADGTLAMLDLYGTVALWRPGQAVAIAVPPSPSGPVSPTLSSDGRLLQFEVHGRPVLWDLPARRSIDLIKKGDAKARVLAVDGKRVALHVGAVVELRDITTGTSQVRIPVPEGTGPEVQINAGGHTLVAMRGGADRSLTHIDPAGKTTRLAIDTAAFSLTLSDDGRWLAAFGNQSELQVWSTGNNKLRHTLTRDVRHVAFARDGRFVAWLEQEARLPKVRARLQPLDAVGDGPSLALDGHPHFIGVTPDGAEVLILLESGELTRWRPGDGTHTKIKEDWLIGIQHVQLADDRRTLLLAGYGRVEIRANDAGLTPLATLHALLDGGWMVISRAGAIDGSATAVEYLVTEVTRADEKLVFPGELGWHGAHVDGVLARALTGEQVTPPVLVRP